MSEIKQCSKCIQWGCSRRNYATDECEFDKYETKTTNKL